MNEHIDDVKADRLFQAAEAVLSASGSAPRGVDPLATFSRDELIEAAAFLARMGFLKE